MKKVINCFLCIVLFIQILSGTSSVVLGDDEITRNSSSSDILLETGSLTEKNWISESSLIITSEEKELIGDNAKEDVIPVEGIYGSVIWRITEDGTLTLEGGQLPDLERAEKSPWFKYSKVIQTVNITKIIHSTEYGSEYLFSELKNLKKINGLEFLDLSKAISIQKMFNQTAVEQLDLSTWNISNVNNFLGAFEGLHLKELNLSNWNVSDGIDFTGMFNNTKIEELNLTNLNFESKSFWNDLLPNSKVGEIIGEDIQKKDEKVSVYFESRGGTEIPPLEVSLDGKVSVPVDPKKEGAVFDGWDVSEDNVNWHKFNFSTVIQEDLTLYARWNYFLDFETNGADSIASQEFNQIDTHPIEPLKLSKPGYEFIGWYLDSNFKTIFDFENSDQLLQSTTLYAKFEKKYKNIDMYADGYDMGGYILKEDVQTGLREQGTANQYNKYVSVNGFYQLWQDFDWSMGTSSVKYRTETLKAKEIYYHSNGSRYYSLYDSEDKWLGYMNADGAVVAAGEQGIFHQYNKYVSVNGFYQLWQGFDWNKGHSSEKYRTQTLEAKGIYYHSNGSRYYSLYDSKGKWLGYMNADGAIVASGEQGIFHQYNKYVSVNGFYQLWQGFDWSKGNSSENYRTQTLEAKGIYYHSNGSRYLSLYDNKGKWLGYMNADGAVVATGEQGIFHQYNKYVSVNGFYQLWQGFDWKNGKSSDQYRTKTLEAKGIYYHSNGSRYLSLYDNKDKWLGYMNADGAVVAAGEQGIFHQYNKYVNVNEFYQLWQGFDWKESVSTIPYRKQTLEVKGIYYHLNGSRYFSLYDNQGDWLGYINENGVRITNGAEGMHQSYGEYVTVNSSKYSIWRNFSFTNKSSGNHFGKRYLAQGVYNHFNGTRYLSLYDTKGKWIGYINSHETDDTYQYWFKKDSNWYYSFNKGMLAKGWKQIDGQWNFFDSKGIYIGNSQAQFISSNISDVLKVTKENKLYPSIMLAQSILESGYGTSELATKANNFFGMKFKENEDEGKYGKYYIETKEYDIEKNEMITVLAPFRKYSNKIQSFKDNAVKLRQGVSWDKNYYQGAWKENSKDYKEVSKALTGKYATDPNYYKKLNQIIETWKLAQFD